MLDRKREVVDGADAWNGMTNNVEPVAAVVGARPWDHAIEVLAITAQEAGRDGHWLGGAVSGSGGEELTAVTRGGLRLQLRRAADGGRAAGPDRSLPPGRAGRT